MFQNVRSTITIGRSGNIIIQELGDIPYTRTAIKELIESIQSLDGKTKVCIGHTSRYFHPLAPSLADADIFVGGVYPIPIKNLDRKRLRDPKTDKADSKRICRFALDHWNKLPQYGGMDEKRNQLKIMNRQLVFT